MDAFQIGNRKPLFFMHIPKTAGMSMRQYLGEQYHQHEILPADRWEDLHGKNLDVRSFRLVRGHFRYNLRELVAPDARMLVVLRDPLRRTVSALRHLARDPNFHHTHEQAKNFTLAEMIRTPAIMVNQRDVQARFLCASRPPADVDAYLEQAFLQHRDVDAGDRENPPDFQLAADRLELIEFVGVTEDLGNLVSAMARDMDFHPPLYFPFVNENPDRSDQLKGLTEAELEILREHNAVDLRLYEFAKKLMNWRSFDHAMRQMISSGVYQIPPGSFEVKIGGIMPGSGWYRAEQSGDNAWRWTGPGRQFTIEVPLRQDASYRFAMTFRDPRPAGPGHLEVEVNDFPMTFDLTADGNFFRCEFDIDQALLAKSSGFCRIQINTGDTVQLTPPDMRLLGILVRKIEFERVQS
jgi:hypothetical protein